MTREEARKAAEVMLAYADGKVIEFICRKSYDKTSITNDPSFNWSKFCYIVKPEPKPKLRPWKPEEVPVGAWIKSKNDFAKKYNYFTTIIGVTSRHIVTAEETIGEMFATFEKELERSEYSVDKGKTWHPCGVLEQ